MYSTRDQRRLVQRRLKILNDLRRFKGNVSKLCRHHGISREIYYRWNRVYQKTGEAGLVRKPPGPPKGHGPHMPSLELENQVVYLRKTYHFGQLKISWYLKRYHDVSISSNGVRNILLRHGLNRLPRNQRKATTAQPKLYEKQQPGYHVQVDVKFLFFKDKENRRIKRYQYTAIDDATRLRILKVYARHTQKSSIDFVNHIVAKFPFRIRQIRTDNGHEFKSQFNWHLRDLGIDHVAIKPASPHLNGKVERSHRIDQEEFYPLVSYVNDDDLQKKIEAWEKYYNRDRPHSAHRGMTPLEALNQKLKLG